jgi:hypothetical protein
MFVTCSDGQAGKPGAGRWPTVGLWYTYGCFKDHGRLGRQQLPAREPASSVARRGHGLGGRTVSQGRAHRHRAVRMVGAGRLPKLT